MRSPLRPYRIVFRLSSEMDDTGSVSENPRYWASAETISLYQTLPLMPALPHGTIAPDEMESARCGITCSGAISRRCPSPRQSGQAACGLLNEKVRGTISLSVRFL